MVTRTDVQAEQCDKNYQIISPGYDLQSEDLDCKVQCIKAVEKYYSIFRPFFALLCSFDDKGLKPGPIYYNTASCKREATLSL